VAAPGLSPAATLGSGWRLIPAGGRFQEGVEDVLAVLQEGVHPRRLGHSEVVAGPDLIHPTPDPLQIGLQRLRQCLRRAPLDPGDDADEAEDDAVFEPDAETVAVYEEALAAFDRGAAGGTAESGATEDAAG